LVSEAFAIRNQDKEGEPVDKPAVIPGVEIEMTSVKNLPESTPTKVKKEPVDDFSAKKQTIHVDKEIDQDPDMVLADLSDGE